MENHTQRRRWSIAHPLLGLWVACVLMAGLLLLVSPNYRWNSHKEDSPYGSDFLQDWIAASIIGAGEGSRLYDAATFDAWQHDSQRIGFTWNTDSYYPAVYPPPYYWICTPLHWLEYRWAVWLWLGILLGAYCLAAAIVERGNAIAPKQPIVWFWPAMLLFPPVLLGLTMGQKGTIWLLLLSGTWLLCKRRKLFMAGMLFGILSIKPTLFFLLPLVMLRYRQWQFVMGASLTWSVLWLAAAASLPTNVWTDFLAVASGAANYHQHTGYQLHWSCNLQALQANLPDWLPAWVQGLILTVLVGYVLSQIVRRAQFDWDDPRQWSQVILATCLLSPHFYAYDLVVLLLPARALWIRYPRGSIILIGTVWGGMLASQPCLDTVGLPLMPVVLLASLYSLSTVTPAQSSVRKGVNGSPAASNMLHTGLSPQA